MEDHARAPCFSASSLDSFSISNMYLQMSSAESLSALERARSSGALAHAEIASAAVAADGTHYFNKCLKHASVHMTEVPLRVEGSSRLVSALAR